MIDSNDPNRWFWDYAFQAENQESYPKIVRDEVMTLADEITEIANLGIDPNELGEKTGGSARRHTLPCGGWFEIQALPNVRPRVLFVVLIVPPPHLL
ncbi:hypothetical protein O3Q52_14360 [Streptomyces sp. ActVer]|uniref:hypothetical protein n=1 Tax=Streptomyces sp. ActVer TaxID=3014558 RepID=UPI0022B53D1D|nr:hypothetical protein [Streptomyces sp. ActVer]MCZ4509359.1 hypothetical protein [Streptomyces sp. ActVer]